MAAPILSDFTFQYRDDGVLLNGDSSAFPFIDVENVKGLDSATYRTSTKDTEGRDGSTIEADFESSRTVTVTGALFASSTGTLEPVVDALKANFSVGSTYDPFYFKAPGVEQRVLYCKCMSGFRSDWDSRRRVASASFSVTLQAGDPIIYGTSLRVGLGVLGSGLVEGYSFPFGFPFTFGTSTTSASTIVASNDGNRAAPWVATIIGSMVNPQLVQLSSGKVVKINLTLASTDVLVIDHATRTATLNGVDRTGKIIKERWFGVMPGGDEVRFLADSGTGTCTLTNFDAWR